MKAETDDNVGMGRGEEKVNCPPPNKASACLSTPTLGWCLRDQPTQSLVFGKENIQIHPGWPSTSVETSAGREILEPSKDSHDSGMSLKLKQ